PADIGSYEGWKSFVKGEKLNIEFDKGLNHDFKTLVQSANFLITTSITEGFGFSYLEPWVLSKLLWGRKLTAICRDFEMNGVQLEHLYTKLRVPVDWMGRRQFYKKWSACVSRTSELFNISVDNAVIRNAFESITRDGIIDFGVLDEVSQKRVILVLIGSRKKTEKLIQLNPFLLNPGSVANQSELIKCNHDAILHNYNPKTYSQRLREIYGKVSNSAVKHQIDKAVVISEFFNLEEFSLLKWSDYGE
ncbi:MAG: hypothetical protein HKO68_01930, partial [Desulfobacterales bacterium]|nr:hypothetical protein [Desulfobacterales bacterium]